MKYYMTETENNKSWKENIDNCFEAKNLLFAKRQATREQFFKGTVLKGLKEFKKMNRNGYPTYFADKDNDEKQASQKWEKILQDMIDGLDYITIDEVETKLWNDYIERKTITREQYLKETKILYDIAEKKAILFIKHINSIWD